MTDFKQSLIDSAVAGGIAAGALGTSHYALKPFDLHPVANYTIGSAACLMAASGYLARRGDKQAAAGLWVIWGLSGSVVAGTYALDWLMSQRRQRKAHEVGDEPIKLPRHTA